MLLSKLKQLYRLFISSAERLNRIERELDTLKVLAGEILNQQKRLMQSNDLSKHEFRVFSQFGEDGILAAILDRIDLPQSRKRFIEIGVEDYTEANTRFLLVAKGWEGLVIDKDQSAIERLRNTALRWRYPLKIECATVTRENINQLLQDSAFDREIGVFSIDIDGNDIWTWDALDLTDPDVVIIEYNSILGCDRSIAVPYNPEFDRTTAHYSWQYWGASLPALKIIGERKGYVLVAGNSAGNNIFFVHARHEKLFHPLSAADVFRKPSFRESRDTHGKLNFISPDNSRKLFDELEVVDLLSNQRIKIKDLKTN